MEEYENYDAMMERARQLVADWKEETPAPPEPDQAGEEQQEREEPDERE